MLVLLLALTAAARAQFSFATNDGMITVTKYTGTNAVVIIPDATNGLPITGIGTRAFEHCTNLTSVTISTNVVSLGNYVFAGCPALSSLGIPDGVTNIGNGAFESCASLANITIPAGVVALASRVFASCRSLGSIMIDTNITSIASDAFFDCASLGSLFIPSSVTNIGEGFVRGCVNLMAITVDPVNPAYSSADGILFNKSGTTLIQCPEGKAGDYVVTNTVTKVENFAFSRCNNLTSVTLPSSVRSVGLFALVGCSNLAAIVVDTNNPVYASIDGVLTDKSQTTLVQYPGGRVGAYTIPGCMTTIGGWAFGGCFRLTGITISSSVTVIRDMAFTCCTNLTNVVVPDSVGRIEDGAFQGCSGLSHVIIGNGLTNLGGFAFAECGSLSGIKFGSNLTSIGSGTFRCSGFAAIVIPDTVVRIGSRAFEDCPSLTNITISPSVTNIEAMALAGCCNLADIAVSSINAYYSSLDGVLFNKERTILVQCPGGKSGTYALPDGVTNIALTAFAVCGSLTNVEIPASVTSIDLQAFAFVSHLDGVYVRGNAPIASPDAFCGTTNATVYYLPGTSGWGASFAGLPTAPWFLPKPVIVDEAPGFGVHSNRFGFTISWATNTSVTVEACADLGNPVWTPVATNILTGGSSYFSDPVWASHPARFYRLRLP